MKTATLIVSLVLTQALIADEVSSPAPGARSFVADSQSMNSKSMDSKMNMSRDTGMPNTSARPLMEGYSVYLFGDALYWQAKVNETDWAVTETAGVAQNGLAVDNVEHKKVVFDWNWGFRAGLGYNMEHDAWDTKVYFTWFDVNGSRGAAVPVQSSTAVAVANGGVVSEISYPTIQGVNPFEGGEIKWKLRYGIFDWDLGRAYNVSKSLVFRPNVGLKGGWINQQINGNFTSFLNPGQSLGTFTQTYKGTNDFWGIGPSGALDTKWLMGNYGSHSFSIFGDFQAALMWGHFNVSSQSVDPLNGYINHKGLGGNQIVPTTRVVLGLGWDTSFNRDRCHFGLKAGYELQYWWNQNQFLFQNIHLRNSDISFHGGTLDVRFDF